MFTAERMEHSGMWVIKLLGKKYGTMDGTFSDEEMKKLILFMNSLSENLTFDSKEEAFAYLERGSSS